MNSKKIQKIRNCYLIYVLWIGNFFFLHPMSGSVSIASDFKMLQTAKMDITVVNPHLTCVLCGGYFIDATTITECLHSFCKKCILVYLESSKCCPICDTQVHQTKSLLNLRPDKTLQDIVYKLVPGLYKTEMKQRREFYSTHSEEPASREDGGEVRDRMVYPANYKISVCIKYLGTDSTNSSESDSQITATADFYKQRYLLCPAAFSITHLYKFIRLKFNLTQEYKVDVLHSDEILHEEMTLADVAYTFGWEEIEPLLLWYRIHDKKIKKVNLPTDRLSNRCDNAVPERHIVTSSGRRVKQLYDIETKISVPPARTVKKRKASGGGSNAGKHSKKSRSEHLKPETDLTPSKVHKDNETSGSKPKSKADKADKQRKERNIFDIISDKNSSDCEPVVPHIAIKISKTGDTKDAWCSQPCQISTPYRSTNKPKQTNETKEHHRKELEEDSGRGSDVSSPSLLSPSRTDPSMSPPAAVQIISSSQDGTHHHHHRRVQDKFSTSPKSSTAEHSSLKTRTKSVSSSRDISPKSHEDSHDSGSSSMPNSPCHSTPSKDDVVSDSLKAEKPHKKRSHKYNSLTIKVPDPSNRCDAASNNLTNGHYSSVIASIPSPENPLLMKITRQISTKPHICQSDNHDRNTSNPSSPTNKISSRSSPPPSSPLSHPSSHPLSQPANLKVSNSNNSQKPPEQFFIPPKSPAKLETQTNSFCNKEQTVKVAERTCSSNEEKKISDSGECKILNSDAKTTSQMPKASIQICQDKPSCTKPKKPKEPKEPKEPKAPKEEKKIVDSTKISPGESESSAKNTESKPKLHSATATTTTITTTTTISDSPKDKAISIDSTCSRVKPYINKTKTSTACASPVMSVVSSTSSTTTTANSKESNSNKQTNHGSPKRPRISHSSTGLMPTTDNVC
ncbi:Polycomb complex protein BMI-1-B [Nymphon striatum]|nr:Polycomb complex protein BMI-1-B [Nymphon striatum]